MLPLRATILLFCVGLHAADHLPNTTPLVFDGDDLSEWVMDGAHEFVERQISEARGKRSQFWNADFSSAAAYEKSIEPNRERFKQIIGVVDQRLPSRLEHFSDYPVFAGNDRFKVSQARWDVLPGHAAEGLLVDPKRGRKAWVIYVPDSDAWPEQVLGIDEPGRNTPLLALAHSGVEIYITTPVSRKKLQTQDRRTLRSDQTHREWIYRQAFHMGRHVIGYEVQQVLAAVDLIKGGSPDMKLAVIGEGEGGLVAFYAGACDSRIDVVQVNGYFQSREEIWKEPIYRNVWSLLREFGDAEIANLILPRKLRIIPSGYPVISGHKGDLSAPEFDSVSNEWSRISRKIGKPVDLIAGTNWVDGLASELGIRLRKPEMFQIGIAQAAFFARQARVFQSMETHVQNLVRASEHVRADFFLYDVLPELKSWRWTTLKTHKLQNAEKFEEEAKAFRKKFHEEAMGKFDEPYVALAPRTRKIAETDKWTAYDVVLQVYPELIAWGALVLPKDLKPGEKRPVVVCQHGRNGVPLDTINRNKTAYSDFAAKLAERGFITFAPHNLYRGEDRYRWLDRKANSIGATLFSFIIAQHEQTLAWLDTLPFVDGDRIAFYGLSYGGETAVRVPTVLEKYCLSICSGDFNQWTRKVAATDQPFSFMRTIEWEMPYWNLGHTFDYAEMAYLMAPRPFMVERGHHDGVGRDHWVAHEYAKVRWLYAQLGLADKTEIEFFQGGHSINGEGTFDFLHRHLNWPKK